MSNEKSLFAEIALVCLIAFTAAIGGGLVLAVLSDAGVF